MSLATPPAPVSAPEPLTPATVHGWQAHRAEVDRRLAAGRDGRRRHPLRPAAPAGPRGPVGRGGAGRACGESRRRGRGQRDGLPQAGNALGRGIAAVLRTRRARWATGRWESSWPAPAPGDTRYRLGTVPDRGLDQGRGGVAGGGAGPDRPFATKPQRARHMLERMRAAGVPQAWVTGDTVHGLTQPWRTEPDRG